MDRPRRLEARLRRITCGEQAHTVAVHDEAGRLGVIVDGTAFAPVVEEIAPGTFVLSDGARRETFRCVRDGDVIHLFWRGTVYRLTDEGEGARAAPRHAAGGLEAPMPGKVIKVSVEPGQAVAKGDEILVVEAMKMENAIRAPRDARVKSVAARVGDMVAPGTVLVEIE